MKANRAMSPLVKIPARERPEQDWSTQVFAGTWYGMRNMETSIQLKSAMKQVQKQRSKEHCQNHVRTVAKGRVIQSSKDRPSFASQLIPAGRPHPVVIASGNRASTEAGRSSKVLEFHWMQNLHHGKVAKRWQDDVLDITFALCSNESVPAPHIFFGRSVGDFFSDFSVRCGKIPQLAFVNYPGMSTSTSGSDRFALRCMSF